ncbi:hypothetical protein HPB47_018763 [Ixodes persulcatus]|uniref:Uncharacterized protein n=1 Tax=Ixodes persulcatus TaxID=34615 RepID=A0AC60QNK0_IXOPE|nr:hypothetical protein HPB47_018763 [Ixodes persulcatus]
MPAETLQLAAAVGWAAPGACAFGRGPPPSPKGTYSSHGAAPRALAEGPCVPSRTPPAHLPLEEGALSAMPEFFRQDEAEPVQAKNRRTTPGIRFEPGVLEEVFKLLETKVAHLKPQERKCVLLLDEMALVEKFEYDPSTSCIRGYVTMSVPRASPSQPPPASQPSLRTVSGPGAPPSGTHPSTSSGPGQTAVPAPQEPPPEPPSATHALVFMIAGISSRWKQVICYHYTGNSFCGKEAASQVKVLIERCNSVGLQVVAVTSDMGSGNRAMWQHFDIYSGRYSRTTNKIPHPQQPGEQINLNGHLVRGQTIVLPADVVTANNLTCPTVSLDPIRQLVEFQKNLTFKLAPKLRPELLDPNHFEKMKVLSHSTATALRFLVENHGWSQDFLTTAWFFEQVNRWFDLMSSRHPVLAISKQNLSSYRNAIEFLTKFQQLFRQLKIGDGAYKPVQAGVVLSTKSVLDLQEMLIDKHSFSFVLTSRFTQDCLENLFSVVRQGNPIPTPLEFKMALKLITLSQYLKASKAGSYELDDASFYLTDLADVTALPTACSDVLPEEIELDMSDPENNSFVYYCGNIVRTVIKNNVTCDICAAAVQVTTTPAHSLLGLKNYVPNVLTCPSEAASTLFARCESVFRSLMHNLVGAQGILDSLSARMVAECQCVRLPECHDIKTKLIRRFCHARLQLFLREKSRKAAARATENREFGSKSMAAPRRRN